MALSPDEIATGRRVSLEEARELQKQGAFIVWRPDGEEYALVIE